MIVTFNYPSLQIIDLNKDNVRKEFSKLIISMECHAYEKIEKCKLLIEYNKKCTITGKIYKRRYFTEEELKEICLKIFKRYYLKDTDIINLEFKEVNPNRFPQIKVKVIKL